MFQRFIGPELWVVWTKKDSDVIGKAQEVYPARRQANDEEGAQNNILGIA
jgi:hypothetical protein